MDHTEDKHIVPPALNSVWSISEMAAFPQNTSFNFNYTNSYNVKHVTEKKAFDIWLKQLQSSPWHKQHYSDLPQRKVRPQQCLHLARRSTQRKDTYTTNHRGCRSIQLWSSDQNLMQNLRGLVAENGLLGVIILIIFTPLFIVVGLSSVLWRLNMQMGNIAPPWYSRYTNALEKWSVPVVEYIISVVFMSMDG